MTKARNVRVAGPMGRPTLYEKPHRTSIMQSALVRDELLPELQQWIGCSKTDVIEKAVREFHRTEKERRSRR